MKISIITITYNSSKTLATTLESVAEQDYHNIEHIIVDGLSKDNTIEIVKQFTHVAKWVSEKDKGLYDALNKGIQMATGDVIGLIHSDDFLASNDAVSKIAKAFQENNVDSIIGDISFVNPDNLKKIIRHYSSKSWKPSKFAKGYMPAHPAFYCKKELFEKYGYYKMGYKIAADYELLIRFLYTHKVSYKYIPETIVMMRTGGTSNENFKSRIVLNQEIVRACAENGIKTNMLKLSLKYGNKVFEYVKPMLNNLFRKK
jgi:glycosyltransferase involved in cell wall biosynthesis